MPHDLQPGDYTYWKRHHLNNFYQVFLNTSCTTQLKGLNSLIHIYHLKKPSELDWSIERSVDSKWYPQEDKKGMIAMADSEPKNPDQVNKIYHTNSIELFPKTLSPY